MNPLPCHSLSRRKAVWGPKRIASALLVTLACWAPSTTFAKPHNREGARKQSGVRSARVKDYRIDDELSKRANDRARSTATTRVIVTLVPGGKLPKDVKRYLRRVGTVEMLDLINAMVLDLPNGLVKQLAASPAVARIQYDRPIATHNYRTTVTVGSRSVQEYYGYNGAGIGVAVIDSGISSWHDDFTNKTAKLFPYGNQRVAKFVDFVNGRSLPYDDNGHGTHVSGIIAGNGQDSPNSEKQGVAPGASIISLKVLDQNGQGTISHIIAALGWIKTNAKTYNIRVVNMSVGAAIRESYWTDPLTLAVKAVTDQGITVVTAAGNMGKNAQGERQYGGITAPGNAPWVLTVGASSTNGTLTRSDDTMAGFSSSGPTFIDFDSKPDLVAPGQGTISLAAPGSTFYITKTAYLLTGKLGLNLGTKPYLTLSGTSMAAPVVAGTVALMLQANPTLTPNLIKAILQYTAQKYPGYSPLRQGGGFLNTLGAVRLAMFYQYGKPGDPLPVQSVWSRRIIWGNHRLKGGVISPTANAWGTNVVWGVAKTQGMTGDNVVWGTAYTGDNVVWGTSFSGDNVVWGTDCGGADCDHAVWGTASDGDNIIWGTANDGDNVVWGTSTDPNVIWSTSSEDDTTWGSSGDDQVVYPESSSDPLPVNPFGVEVPLVLPSLEPVVGSMLSVLPVSLGGF